MAGPEPPGAPTPGVPPGGTPPPVLIPPTIPGEQPPSEHVPEPATGLIGLLGLSAAVAARWRRIWEASRPLPGRERRRAWVRPARVGR